MDNFLADDKQTTNTASAINTADNKLAQANNRALAYEAVAFDSALFLQEQTANELAAAEDEPLSALASGEYDLATKKLIILRIVERLPDLTEQELLSLTLDSLYLDYFTFSNAFAELQQDGLLSATLRKREMEHNLEDKQVKRLEITAKGEQVLRSLDLTLPKAVRHFIDQLYLKHCQKLQSAAAVKRHVANYKEQGSGYLLELTTYLHKEQIFKLALIVAEEAQAQQLKQQWESQTQDLQAAIIKLLLQA